MNTSCPVCLFGPGSALDPHGKPIPLRSRKQLALLAYLAVEYQTAHSRDALMALLWPDETAASAQNNLRVTLSRLRELGAKLGGVGSEAGQHELLLTDRQTVQINPAQVQSVDLNRFTELFGRTRQHVHASRSQCSDCQNTLKEAVSLYRADFLSGFGLDDCPEFEEWLAVQRERLHVLVTDAYADLAIYAETNRQLSAALGYTVRQIELDPLRESAYRQQMRILALQGERSAALAVYGRCRMLLNDTLGIDPEPETQNLYARILAGEFASQSPPAGDPPTLTARTNLPQQLTPFIGREDELVQLCARLGDRSYRLLSIIGPGGVGKSRLAQQVAARLIGTFAEGVYYVPLAQVQSVDSIPAAIVESLGAAFTASQSSPFETLVALIDGKSILLVLDNFEHLTAGGELLAALLQRTPKLVVLVTSRERLNMQIEDHFDLAGLPTPNSSAVASADQYPAVRLFVDRAHRLSKSFKLTSEQLPYVVRICQWVEGFPLAIELAATWVDDLTCEEIVKELSAGLARLETSQRDVDPAHRSLRAVFDSSWRLLSEAEQRALASISIFRGGFSVDAARVILGVAPTILNSLRHKSLLRSIGSRRYDMHALVKQFSAASLSADADAESRVYAAHSRYFLMRLADEAAALDTLEARGASDRIQLDWDNIVAAWRYAVDQEAVELLQAALYGLSDYCSLRVSLAETHALLNGTIARFDGLPDSDQPSMLRQTFLCHLLTTRARFLLFTHLDDMWAVVGRAIALAQQINNMDLVVSNLIYQAAALEYRGDFGGGLALAEQGLKLAQQHDLELQSGRCLEMIGYCAFKTGDYARATDMYRRLQEIHTRTGRLARLSLSGIGVLGCMALDEGRYEAGLRYFQEELRDREAMADKRFIADAQHMLACAWLHLGYYERALELETLSAQGAREIENKPSLSAALLGKAWTYRQLGQFDEALACATEAVAVARGYETSVVFTYALAQLAEARMTLAHTDQAWAEAEATFREVAAIAQAMGNSAAAHEAEIGLAELAYRQGRIELARQQMNLALPHLPTAAANGWAAPIQAYVVCTRILRAVDDPSIEPVYARGLQLLKHLAGEIVDLNLRQNFLTAVPAHRELQALSAP